jgi:hypothetical protein
LENPDPEEFFGDTVIFNSINYPIGLNWTESLSSKKYRVSFILTLAYLIFLVAISSSFFAMIQKRNDVAVPDPILAFFQPADVSDEIFSVLYIFIFATVVYLIKKPEQLLFALQAYGLMMTMRFITIYLVPLDTPPGIVTLRDPMARLFFYEDGSVTKDLFFSGHAATLFLFFFLVDNKILAYCILAGALVLSVLLLILHTHYSYDVLAAPVFAYAAYKITGRLFKNPRVFPDNLEVKEH